MKLHKRFPYQFAAGQLMVSLGWLALLEKTCQDIDKLLGDNKRGFRWTEIRQKYGGLHLYYEIEGRDDEIRKGVDKIVFDTELRSEQVCEICGEPGAVQQQDFWQDTLCMKHREMRKTMKTGDWRALVSYERLYKKDTTEP